jgi:hypothetical protein
LGERTCNTCGITKPLQDYGIRSDSGYYKRRCKPCDNEWHKLHYARNRLAKKQRAKEYYQKPGVKEHRKAYRNSRKQKDKIWKKNWDLEKKYGINLDALIDTIKAQHNHCPICRTYYPTFHRAWHVDHCHVSGKIRGVICNSCNILLGHAKDRPRVLRNAAEYLEKNA